MREAGAEGGEVNDLVSPRPLVTRIADTPRLPREAEDSRHHMPSLGCFEGFQGGEESSHECTEKTMFPFPFTLNGI